MPKHIILAYDETDAAQTALHTAVEIASASAARLTVAHVALPPLEEPVDEREAISMELLGTEDHLRWNARLATVAAELRDRVAVRTSVRVGAPGPEIVRLAEETGADLVVSGARAVGGLRQLLRAAVPDLLLTRARSPVLVVPAAADPQSLAADVIEHLAAGRAEVRESTAVVWDRRRRRWGWGTVDATLAGHINRGQPVLALPVAAPRGRLRPALRRPRARPPTTLARNRPRSVAA